MNGTAALLHNMTLGGMLAEGEKSVGENRFWIYDARTQNCQFFMKWILQHTPAWNATIEKFVMQDAEKVLDGLGYLDRAARAVTDIAGVADVAMNGRGRRCYGGRRCLNSAE